MPVGPALGNAGTTGMVPAQDQGIEDPLTRAAARALTRGSKVLRASKHSPRAFCALSPVSIEARLHCRAVEGPCAESDEKRHLKTKLGCARFGAELCYAQTGRIGFRLHCEPQRITNLLNAAQT